MLPDSPDLNVFVLFVKFGHFTMDDLQDIGVDFALALVDFTCIDNCVICLDALRSTGDLYTEGSLAATHVSV